MKKNIAFNRTFNQFFKVYIKPELKRRKDSGSLPADFHIDKAQIIFYPDDRRPEIRLNGEVSAKIVANLKKGKKFKTGEVVTEQDVQSISEIRLSDQDDPDCGHITFIKFRNEWVFQFDFQYNKALSAKYRKNALQFLEMAKTAYDKNYWGPFIENLFSAAELLIKAKLLGTPDPKLVGRISHGALQSRYNLFSKLGNVNPLTAKAFNRLMDLRPMARYLRNKNLITLDKKEAGEMLNIIAEII